LHIADTLAFSGHGIFQYLCGRLIRSELYLLEKLTLAPFALIQRHALFTVVD